MAACGVDFLGGEAGAQSRLLSFALFICQIIGALQISIKFTMPQSGLAK